MGLVGAVSAIHEVHFGHQREVPPPSLAAPTGSGLVNPPYLCRKLPLFLNCWRFLVSRCHTVVRGHSVYYVLAQHVLRIPTSCMCKISWHAEM